MGATKPQRRSGPSAVADGGGAAASCEAEGCDAAPELPSRPATRMGAVWSRAARAGHRNVAGRPLLLLEVERESLLVPAAAGLALTGLRATGFLSGPGLLAARAALPQLATRQLALVLHLACSNSSGQGGHEAYHAVADTGFFQLFANDAQQAADLTLIARRVAEQALCPGILAQDAWLTAERSETLLLPGRDLIGEFLGRPEDLIEPATPAQRLLFGAARRRVPEWWCVDQPAMTGAPLGDEVAAAALAARRPYFAQPLAALADAAMAAYGEASGRRYARAGAYRTEDADYLIVAQGGIVPSAEAAADHFRAARKIKVGVVSVTMLRPFPGDLLGALLKNRKGVLVLERVEQPLAEDPPLMREIRAALGKCLENGRAVGGPLPFPDHASFAKLEQAPPLFSAAFGLGGVEPEPEALVGAVENLLPEGRGRRQVFLSIPFQRAQPRSPKEEIFLQTLSDGYPGLDGLTVRGSENPSLLPQGALAVGVLQISGQELWHLEENLAPTLFGLTGLHVKAFRAPGEHARGRHTAFYLVAAREAVRANCPIASLDMVIATDPRVFTRTNPLEHLRQGGVLVLQSNLQTGGEVCAALPPKTLAEIAARRIAVFFLDAAAIAAELAAEPAHRPRLAGLVFQGAALAAPPVATLTGLAGKALPKALRELAREKSSVGGWPQAGPELEALLRGTQALHPVSEAILAEKARALEDAEQAAGMPQDFQGGPEALPSVLKGLPPHPLPVLDLHRLWESSGAASLSAGPGTPSLSAGSGAVEPETLAEPFLGAGVLPAGSAIFGDLSATREAFPRWLPALCTGCGECWLVCPDSALPGLVSEVGALLAALVERVEAGGNPTAHLPRAVRTFETRLRERLGQGKPGDAVDGHFRAALADTLAASTLPQDGKAELAAELGRLEAAWGGFPLALTEPFFAQPEKTARGSGGLLSVTLDPSKCTACMACAAVCPEQALVPQPQTGPVLAQLRRDWELWRHLPNTPESFLSTGEGGSEPARLLLDKAVYLSLLGGAGAASTATGRAVLHLFTAGVVAALQPRVAAHVARLEDLTARLEKHLQLHLTVKVADPEALQRALRDLEQGDFTLAQLSDRLDPDRSPVDALWLRRGAGLLADLTRLRRAYSDPAGQARAALGMVQGGGAAPRFPYNPFPFPWTPLAGPGGPALAMGVFEGHMARMAWGFRAVRMAELELEEKYNPQLHDAYFESFGWRDFTEQEFLLAPPVALVGGEQDFYGESGGAFAELLRSGRPLRMLCLDSAGHGALSTPAPAAAPLQGAESAHFAAPLTRRDAAAGLGLGGAFVAQCSLADISHLMESFQAGLAALRPAVFHVFNGWLPEAAAPDALVAAARLALESRAYPLFRYDPAAAEAPHQCLSLAGNPALQSPWPVKTLDFLAPDGSQQTIEAPFTLADAAAALPGFEHHFRQLPPGDDDALLPLTEFLELSPEQRAEARPFVWALDQERHLRRLAVSSAMAAATLESLGHWQTLRRLARLDVVPPDEAALAERTRAELVETVTQTLLELAGGGGELSQTLVRMAVPGAGNPGGEGDHV